MIIKKNVRRAVSEVKDIKCNACGNSCSKNKNFRDAFEFATIEASWGYFSDNRDGEIHQAHLCQPCFDALINNFVIQTKIANCL